MKIPSLARPGFALLFACVITSSSILIAQTDSQGYEVQTIDPDGTVQTQSRQIGRAINSDDAAIRIQLQAILDVQAQYGQYPGNNPLLGQIQAMLSGQPAIPPTVVRVTNRGPGRLNIVRTNAPILQLSRNQSYDIQVGLAQIGLFSELQYASISFQHMQNAPCQFWDDDDQVHTNIEPGFDFNGNPRQYQFTLTPGQRGYHLEQ